MRDYPAIPNVFRINSSSNILLDDQNQRQPSAAQKNYLKNEHENINSDISYQYLQHQHYKSNSNDEGLNGARQYPNPYIDTISQAEYQSNGHLNKIPRENSCRPVSIRTGEDRLFTALPVAISKTALQTGILSSVSNKRNNYILWIVTPVAARYVYTQIFFMCRFFLYCERNTLW